MAQQEDQKQVCVCVCVCVHCVVLVSDPKNNTINVRLWTVILNGGGG